MKKSLSALLALCLLLTVFTGLAAASDSEKTILNFYMPNDMEMTAIPIVESYNASQDKVEVVMSVIPNDGYDDKMKVLTTGDSDIDVFWIRTPAQAQQYISNGILISLKPFAQAAGLDTFCANWPRMWPLT